MTDDCHKSYFFNSREGDRKYDADSFSDWLRNFFTNGIFTGGAGSASQFEVLPAAAGLGNALNVRVAPGYGFINGKVCNYFSPVILPLELADSGYRIDSVVLRLDAGGDGRDIYLTVLQGTASMSKNAATPPAIVRDEYYYDLKICDVFIPYAAVEILPENITDTRLDNRVCGIVAQAVNEIDGSTLFAQLQAFLTNQYAVYNALYHDKIQDLDTIYAAFADTLAGLETRLHGQFETWFDGVKTTLSEDAAAGVILDVTDLKHSRPAVTIASIKTYKTQNAFGISGAGDTPFGGGNLTEIQTLTAFDGEDDVYGVVKIIAPAEYEKYTNVNKITDNFFAIFPDDGVNSLVTIIA